MWIVKLNKYVFICQWFPAHSVGAVSGVEFSRADTVDAERHGIIQYITRHLYSVSPTNASQYPHHLLAPIS